MLVRANGEADLVALVGVEFQFAGYRPYIRPRHDGTTIQAVLLDGFCVPLSVRWLSTNGHDLGICTVCYLIVPRLVRCLEPCCKGVILGDGASDMEWGLDGELSRLIGDIQLRVRDRDGAPNLRRCRRVRQPPRRQEGSC